MIDPVSSIEHLGRSVLDGLVCNHLESNQNPDGLTQPLRHLYGYLIHRFQYIVCHTLNIKHCTYPLVQCEHSHLYQTKLIFNSFP